ncbi:MAG: 16S rRNA (adenine(1518)-N(6)/adenine(1519)-N(6))-dimethyltransferase, partial [Oscillospiraceae bacterium]|nr:16S rRNA (adenine(1518)-N(6)/adenine(1519)-N(6))-dimethyltransferase [Oscillospiraceae bacterium]
MDLCNPSEIKTLLESNGFHFSKSLGQNFLIEGRVPLKIAEGAGIDETFGVLEIGPGIGALTKRLSERAGKVVAVELDKSLPKLLAVSLADCDNVEIISGDILKTDIEALVKEKFAGLRLAVCANLPYNITTPVLTKLMDTGLFETITV